MTRSLSVNSNNDIHAIGGRLQIATGITSVLQTCERVMKALRGEMRYAQERGVNYFDDVWSGSPNVIRFEANARAQILQVAGVISITAFNAVVRDNVLFYQVTINTEFGAETINGNL